MTDNERTYITCSKCGRHLSCPNGQEESQMIHSKWKYEYRNGRYLNIVCYDCQMQTTEDNTWSTTMALIRQSRKARSVPRFTGQKFIKPPNIAEHGWATANLFYWLSKMWMIPITVEEYDFVLNHDMLETESGDLLFTAKKLRPELWAQIEDAIVTKYPVFAGYRDTCNPLNEETRCLFKYCDYIEGLLTSIEELKQGNSFKEILGCCDTYENAIKELVRSPEGSKYLGEKAIYFMDHVKEIFKI